MHLHQVCILRGCVCRVESAEVRNAQIRLPPLRSLWSILSDGKTLRRRSPPPRGEPSKLQGLCVHTRVSSCTVYIMAESMTLVQQVYV